jgi:lipopolysaccharide transport protein LptA
MKVRQNRIYAALLSLALLGIVVGSSFAQPKVTGKISGGFQAPTSTDERGRRHVLKGTSAEPRGDNLYELTEPRVTSFDADDTPEMFIEAPRCFYQMRGNNAYSDSTLSVRTADGRFAIEGLGWRWQPDAAALTISNQVTALVQKSALATNLTSNTGTNAPVRITATSFRQAGERASFIGDVVVKDGNDTLRCQQLDIVFVKPDGLQTIEAIENVELERENAKVQSGRAVYDFKKNEIRISENPRWSSEQREGSANVLILNRTENTLVADGNVYMRLPLTNVANTATAGGGTNRFLDVRANYFKFEEATSNRLARAIYRSNVSVVHPEATILAAELTVSFNATNRIERIEAEENVAVHSGANVAFGEHAEFDLASEKIVLSGRPHWKVEESTGKSELLMFYPKTQELHALRDVEMIVPGRSVGTLFAVNVKTNQAAGTNAPMTIRADSFSRGTNVAVFNENVVIADDRGKMMCQLVTLVTAGTNQLERVIAEGGVRLEQPGMVATGSRAEYNVATGFVHLTGSPELVSEGRSLRADAFIINRNENTFSVSPGKFRIQMPMAESKRNFRPNRQ